MFKKKIEHLMGAYNMVEKDERIAVAFSGGADSTVLLHYLNTHRKNVCAIHINHMIRGEEADRDEEFCRLFCQSRNISFFSKRVDVPAYSKKEGVGMEEAARILRYQAIEEICTAQGITKVATAHHADDNAETLLFNIARGASLAGARGIPAVRGMYIRPLLSVTRDEILLYAKANGVEYVNDSTNTDTEYTRNYIRHKIIPSLKRVNPKLCDAIHRFTKSCTRDEDYLSQAAAALPADISRRELSSLHDALLSRRLEILAKKAGAQLSYTQLDTAITLVRDKNNYHTLDISDKVEFICDRNRVYFTARSRSHMPSHAASAAPQAEASEATIPLTPLNEGENNIPHLSCSVFLTTDLAEWERMKNIYKISIYTTIDFDNIKGNLYLRTRQPHDGIRAKGMTKKVKKLLCDSGIPVRERDTLPFITDSEGIVWIPSVAIRDNAKNKKETERKLYIGYKRHYE